jgi:hypothetical protein
MKAKTRRYFLVLFSLILIVLSVLIFLRLTRENSLAGEFAFKIRAPEVALVYFSEDESLSLEVWPVIDQEDKQFIPQLVVGAPGARIVLENSDTMKHGMYARDKELNVNFDVDPAKPGEVRYQAIDWEENNVVQIGCKIHPMMKAWVACISSRYYQAVEFKKGEKTAAFKIEDIPTNLTKVKIWAPGYLPTEVAIQKGESKSVELKKGQKVSGVLRLELM